MKGATLSHRGTNIKTITGQCQSPKNHVVAVLIQKSEKKFKETVITETIPGIYYSEFLSLSMWTILVCCKVLEYEGTKLDFWGINFKAMKGQWQSTLFYIRIVILNTYICCYYSKIRKLFSYLVTSTFFPVNI